MAGNMTKRQFGRSMTPSRLLVFCALATGISLPLMAQKDEGLPPFKPSASCRNLPDIQTCTNMEMEARQQLAAIWTGLSAAKKKECRELAQGVPGGSYVTALSCAKAKRN